ncbi:MAG: MBL fold metallo-hydrolase [Pseudobutyrivibrio ruminis]|nr:MBL fold metallo-hydrolase [Pseudobutyrivibrio ruminis]
MVSLKYFLSMTRQYWNVGYALIFVAALVGIFILEKEKIKRYTLLWFSLLVLVFIYNPITLYCSKKILESTTFDQYYLRFFSLIPVMIVIAYMFTLLLKQLTGAKKLMGMLAVCIVLAVFGNCIYTEDWFTKAENRNKVPQDVITICDIFADYEGDSIRIMAPQNIAVYLRQVDSRFSMPYSRSVPDEALELESIAPEVDDVARYASANNVDYVVVWANQDTLDAFLNYGFTLYGRTANYAVLTPFNPNWLVTEYPMASGDQGMFYTVENTDDGTLIVIDGGDAENEQTVRDAIMELGGEVDAWILTHYHQDHIDAFNAIYADPKEIKIDEIYVTPLTTDIFYDLNLQEWDDVDTYEAFMELTEGDENIHQVSRDEKLQFSDNLTLTFINSCDTVVLGNNEDIPNNASLVFRMETEDRSMLVCGDAHSQYLAEYLVENYAKELDVDILQCGHHGSNSMPETTGFYEACSPEVAIFDTPDKIMTSPDYSAGALAGYLQGIDTRIVWYKSAPNVFGL